MFEDVNTPGPRPPLREDPRQPALPFSGWVEDTPAISPENSNEPLTDFQEDMVPAESAAASPEAPVQETEQASEFAEEADESEFQEEDLSDEPEELEDVSDLLDWKDALRRDFESWLDSIDSLPELEQKPSGAMDTPDLYSFYQQLALANTEARKANRRTVEAFNQWGETLTQFERQLTPLRETAAQLAAAQPAKEGLGRAYCLVLVELLDRMQRLSQAFESPPREKGWWNRSSAAWQSAWERQRQALAILYGHFESFLRKEGVTRLEVVNQPFDPAIMVAVASEPDASRPPQTVLEELGAGYRHHGELLRPAQVKVSVRP